MWPFKKRQPVEAQPSLTESLTFSQVDYTERFDDDSNLKPEDWITTIPLSSGIKNPESMGLPPVKASADEIYKIASNLSRMRESIPNLNDGVYCAVCHLANVDIAKLRTPCPKCGRELLQFGWD
jgi:hypothetical protein